MQVKYNSHLTFPDFWGCALDAGAILSRNVVAHMDSLMLIVLLKSKQTSKRKN